MILIASIFVVYANRKLKPGSIDVATLRNQICFEFFSAFSNPYFHSNFCRLKSFNNSDHRFFIRFYF